MSAIKSANDVLAQSKTIKPSTWSLADWQQCGRYYDYQGQQVFYRDSIDDQQEKSDQQASSEKPVLLLIHGFPTASWDWYEIWPTLANDYRLIAIDMIGFGFSAKPKHYRYSIMTQTDLIEALLAELSIAHCHILAHDYGDTVCQELVARFQERLTAKTHDQGLTIQSVCLLNGGLFPETHRARLIQKLLNSPLGFLIAKLTNKNRFYKSLSAVFAPDKQPTPAQLEQFWQLASHNNGVAQFHQLIGFINERKKHRSRWLYALQKCPAPLRLINGLLDPISGQHMVERYQQLIDNADIVALPDASHYPQVEVPEQVLHGFYQFQENIANAADN